MTDDEAPMFDSGEAGDFHRALRWYGTTIAESCAPDPDLSDEDREACGVEDAFAKVLGLVGLTLCGSCTGAGAHLGANLGVSECAECGGDGVMPISDGAALRNDHAATFEELTAGRRLPSKRWGGPDRFGRLFLRGDVGLIAEVDTKPPCPGFWVVRRADKVFVCGKAVGGDVADPELIAECQIEAEDAITRALAR